MRKIEIKSTHKKGQGNPAETPIRREKELQDTRASEHTHTNTHTFKKRYKGNKTVCCGREGGRERRKKRKRERERGRLKSQDLDRVKLEEQAE